MGASRGSQRSPWFAGCEVRPETPRVLVLCSRLAGCVWVAPDRWSSVSRPGDGRGLRWVGRLPGSRQARPADGAASRRVPLSKPGDSTCGTCPPRWSSLSRPGDGRGCRWAGDLPGSRQARPADGAASRRVPLSKPGDPTCGTCPPRWSSLSRPGDGRGVRWVGRLAGSRQARPAEGATSGYGWMGWGLNAEKPPRGVAFLVLLS